MTRSIRDRGTMDLTVLFFFYAVKDAAQRFVGIPQIFRVFCLSLTLNIGLHFVPGIQYVVLTVCF